MTLIKKLLKLLLLFFISQNIHAASSLWFTEIMVNVRYDVDNISYQKLQKKLIDSHINNILIFDVRRPEEYQQSRIKGSIQINPDMKVDEFMTLYGDKILNKELIFYCSVGYRSSEFIQRIEKNTDAKIIKKMFNLTGGIFRWYNENLPVFNDAGETNEIHPSDESWAKLIKLR